MTTQTPNKAPIYELGFCAKKGTDGRGGEILGSMVRLGAVWERKDATKGGLVDFYTKAASPFGALGEGVVFLLPPNLPEQRDANKPYPIYELGFCAKRGKTQSGQDILGAMVRVATVWPRKDASKGGIVDYHLDPASPFASLGDGVVFLIPTETKGSTPQPANQANEPHDPETGEVLNGHPVDTYAAPALEQI